MNYDLLEKAIVDRLQPLRGLGFEVVAIPENDKDVERPFKFGRVTVAYIASQFNDDGFNGRPMIFSTNEIVQKETAEIEVIFQCRMRSGAQGVHGLQQRVRALLVGFEPDSWGRLYCREMRFVSHQDGIWTYAMTLFCIGLSVQACDPNEPPPVYITQITVDEPYLGQTVVDNNPAYTDAPLRFTESSTISVQFELTQNGQPKDLTGYEFRFGIKQLLGDDVPLIVKNGTVSGNIVSAWVPSVENVLLPGNYKAVFEMISAGNVENEIVFNLIIEPQLI